MTRKRKGKVGSSFEDFLKDDDSYEEIAARAEMRLLAWQIQKAMNAKKISKQKMAGRMKTSLTQVNNLLDPDNGKVSLETIHRAASALGKRVCISLEDTSASS